MEKTDEKMLLIGSAISRQVEQERRSIIDKANDIRDKALSECKDQLIEEMFSDIQRKTRAVRQKAIRDKAQAEAGAHREVLTHRGELADQVFGAVTARLHEYAASEAYREALLAAVAAVKEKNALFAEVDHSASVVLVREADMGLAPEIRSLLPGCEVQSTRRIRIGGFQLRNRAAGLLLDETLDQKLGDQRPWFFETCGLQVVE